MVEEVRFELTSEELFPCLSELPQLPSQVQSLPALPFLSLPFQFGGDEGNRTL
jgi:hypothetical protein